MRIIAVFDDYTPDNGVTEATGLVQTVAANEFYTDTEFGFQDTISLLHGVLLSKP